ncbi:hypothetical protein GOBAR_AA11348 [Gossypium barbadense]|uniref:Endonuclease/exonuclease/phosphatase domain-containing protein n=1 Tax=Gossypium barbadense TaxID=3634 RepID=A0A2P5Y139_GOSBA|nr:hypothetical protein GOBAR_AA11348 [Gossypium barbadense]
MFLLGGDSPVGARYHLFFVFLPVLSFLIVWGGIAGGLVRVPVEGQFVGCDVFGVARCILDEKTNTDEDKEFRQTNSRDESGHSGLKGIEKGGEEGSISTSPVEKRVNKPIRDSLGRFNHKRKRMRMLNGNSVEESLSKTVRRRLMECASPVKERKSTVLMEDFRTIVDELAMVDLKTDNGWFTWVNNREGPARVKERLDRFLISANTVNSFPFLETRVIRQSISDHDAISLDTEGRRPRDGIKDPRLCFKYDVCWARNKEAKTIIKEAWQCGSQDTMEKITIMGNELGRW